MIKCRGIRYYELLTMGIVPTDDRTNSSPVAFMQIAGLDFSRTHLWDGMWSVSKNLMKYICTGLDLYWTHQLLNFATHLFLWSIIDLQVILTKLASPPWFIYSKTQICCPLMWLVQIHYCTPQWKLRYYNSLRQCRFFTGFGIVRKIHRIVINRIFRD